MESQLCNEPGETSEMVYQRTQKIRHLHSRTLAVYPCYSSSVYVTCGRVTGVEKQGTRQSSYHKLSVLSYSIAYVLPSSKDPRTNSEYFFLLVFFSVFYRTLCPGFRSTGQSSHPDYDPVNVHSMVREIASLQGKLQATRDEGEQCALEEDITGKILWFYWQGIRSEVDQLLPKVVDCIRNDADEDYHYRTGLRQIAEIIKRALHEIPDDDIVHLRRVMYDAGTGVSKHRLWLDAQAIEQAELSRIFGDKPILAIEEIASSTSPEFSSTSIV
ncbi:hypothetical protein EDC04DRAFT_118650 [Pisolithus marmoratus]|nr:hypothetical protein EDC04DRAFT_118650 [Pisolithus marmoratus]